MSYYEQRNLELEAALEGLLEQFDTGGSEYTIEVLGDLGSVDTGTVTYQTAEAIERALEVLYNSNEPEE